MRRGAAGLGPAVGSSRTGQKREPPLLSFFMGKSEIKYLRKNYENSPKGARQNSEEERNTLFCRAEQTVNLCEICYIIQKQESVGQEIDKIQKMK